MYKNKNVSILRLLLLIRRMKSAVLACASFLLALAASVTAHRSPHDFAAMARQRREQARVQERDTRSNIRTESTPAKFTFSHPKAKDYWVNGKTIPDVDFDVGDSWSGLMPISGAKNETRKLFFWFFPAKHIKHINDLVFWTNGGPGCSSLEGFLQENGPFTWPSGTAKPIPNQWSWTNLTSMLWVEQPVGTGFSQGVPNISNDDELAAQVAGFLVQFLEVFHELKHKNFYVSGESYAGYYVPYIANYLYEHPGLVPLNVKGIWITDPSLSWALVQQYIVALPMVQKFPHVFALNSSFVASLQKRSDACGYTGYSAKYATYPPAKDLPNNITEECALFDDIYYAEFLVNPNFNIYRILDVWPVLWDVLGFPGSFLNSQSPIYFARRDVQDAIHAPHIDWTVCSNNPVYVGDGDTSLGSSLSVLPNVIEKSARTVIMHGGVDFVLIAEGTSGGADGLIVQNRNPVWGGAQGFQKPIEPESFSINGFGILGTAHQERITYVEVNLAGHMMPEYAPWAAYKTLWYLLGRGPLDSTEIDASLYPNNFELTGSWSP
ncbi:hypothetical protein BS47DRAFT_1378162 [Hydnum rufescens UP504]|uniref:Carboxypeptidase n=1 Tax=Hydnum rufescens UP504 TaxID=1448309 RepID=A0A9P6DPY4_9AGAM|nr:hypothetical protein BS47DRAFT_1378162 [Hydnum rufescens UP504]